MNQHSCSDTRKLFSEAGEREGNGEAGREAALFFQGKKQIQSKTIAQRLGKEGGPHAHTKSQ